MKPSAKYTCTEYRLEMILLALKRQLDNPGLPEAEKMRIVEEVRQLEQQMEMD